MFMETQEAGSERPRKGRVVMLVDNKVEGDSRVQKAAESMAAAGWDVTLLGLVRSGSGRSWKLGDADVRLLPLKTPLAKRHAERHRSLLRRPLAYPPGPLGAYRRQWAKAWRADVATRRAALKVVPEAVGSPGFRKAEQARLALAGPASKVMQRWIELRSRHSTEAQKAGRRLQGPLDRAFTATWKAAKGRRAWRRLEPALWDYELTYGKEIDALKPDLIHANDFRMLGVGARAAVRARAAGRKVKLVWDAHEFLPGVRPWEDNAHWIPGNTAHESEYAPYADAVVTVSEGLGDLLRERHSLTEQPTVVLNAPDKPVERPDEADADPVPDLRELCGIGPDVPLVVYSGSPGPQRGLGDMVEALPQLDGVHGVRGAESGRRLHKGPPGPGRRAGSRGPSARGALRPALAGSAVPVRGERRLHPDPPLAEPRDRADHEVLRVLPRPASAGRERCEDHVPGDALDRAGRGLHRGGRGRPGARDQAGAGRPGALPRRVRQARVAGHLDVGSTGRGSRRALLQPAP